MQGFIQPFDSGGYETVRGDDRGHESRREALSGDGSGKVVWGSGGVTPGKFLKFETQFGAIWCILARN